MEYPGIVCGVTPTADSHIWYAVAVTTPPCQRRHTMLGSLNTGGGAIVSVISTTLPP
jgi:hypothetical protein